MFKPARKRVHIIGAGMNLGGWGVGVGEDILLDLLVHSSGPFGGGEGGGGVLQNPETPPPPMHPRYGLIYLLCLWSSIVQE